MRAAQYTLVRYRAPQSERTYVRRATLVLAALLVLVVDVHGGLAQVAGTAGPLDAPPALDPRGDWQPAATAYLHQPGFISAGKVGVSMEPARPWDFRATSLNEPVAAQPTFETPRHAAAEFDSHSSGEQPGTPAASWLHDFVPLWRQVTGVTGGHTVQAAAESAETMPPGVSIATAPGGAVAAPTTRAVESATATNRVQSSATDLWQPLIMRQDSHADLMNGIGDRKSQTRNIAANDSTRPEVEPSLWQFPLVAQLAFASNGDLTDPIDAKAATSGTQLIAYLQEATPEPEEMDINSAEELVPEPPAASAARRDPRAGAADSLAEAEQLGEEPEDRSLEFLRTETVLLKPGESQCDVGINYLLTETDFPILLADDMDNIVAVDEVSFRIRELSVPLEYRLGLHPRLQGFIGLPIGWSNTQLALDAFDAFQNDGGIGDLDFGLTMQLVDATANCPYWIGTLQATAPTGGDPFSNVIGLAPTAPSLGQGFWSIAGNLLLIQPYDPVVVFYGLGVERFFERQFVGLEIEPGTQYNYTFGVGFAVNERITLSTRFFGAYVEELEVDGQRRFGTNAEPLTVRMSATISQPCDRLVEPFVEFGITDDAVSSFVGITWTFSPQSHHKPQEQAPTHAKK
jgi:hypothetical protein